MEALLENTDYPALEILLLDTGASNPVTREFINALDAVNTPQLRVFRLDNPVNPIQAANLLAEQAQGEHLVFLRPGLAPTPKTWLDDLVAMASESMVGAVAPRILDKKGRVHSSGLLVGIDQGTADAYQGMAHLDAGVSGRAHLNQRFSSLPGNCLVTRHEVFSAAVGLDAEQAETLDNAFADYGLRLTSAGLACLWTPFTSLLSTEQEAAKPRPPLPDRLFEGHINLLRRDQVYHPALTPKTPLFSWEKRPELITERFPWHPLPRILSFHADLGGCGYYRIIEPAKALSVAYRAETSASCYIFGATEIARVNPNTLVMQRQINDPFQGRSDAFAQTIAQAIAGVNLLVARKILPGLSDVAATLGSGGTLLEVGCGTGKLQLQLAKAFANARCTGIDIDPTGLAAARAAVREAGFEGRVQIVEGDVASAVAPASFDVVVMVEVLHEIAPAIRPGVVAACARALRPGGWLVIVDETYPATLAEARLPQFQFPLQTGLESPCRHRRRDAG